MRFDKVLLTVIVRLKPEELWGNLPRSADIIGKMLADIAEDYVTRNRTGYYPAIDFFRTLEDIDPGLITSAEQAAWRVAKLAREKIQSKLGPIFSSVRFQSIQNTAFSLPRVRPKQENAITELAGHYTPDTVKIELVLSLLRRDSQTDDGRTESYARKMIYRWLQSEFATVEVTNSKAL